MKSLWTLSLLLALFTAPVFSKDTESSPVKGTASSNVYNFNVGVGKVNITPKEEVTLAGSPSPKKTSIVETPLFVKAMVISAGDQKLAIVTLDTLKYPTRLIEKVLKNIEKTTHIPASNIIICASHTHAGPLWSYYEDKLVTSIEKAVVIANNDLAPCKIGTAKGKAEAVNQNRRVLIDGEAWNRWQLKPSQRGKYPAEGPADRDLNVLAVVGKDGKYKAVLYNYASHAANTRGPQISADYPGHIQKYVEEHLGYEVPTLFLTGACGDVNPNYSKPKENFNKKLGEEMLNSLGSLEFIDKPTLCIESVALEMPGRENPEFKEEEVFRKWPGQFEHYRKVFKQKKQRERPTYKFLMSGIRIGDNFAIVTNPVELFCQIGMNIKENSPFKNTMVSTLTNGARGYVPTERSFELGGYETWFGEHSFLTIQAGNMIEKESSRILKQLENKE